MSDDRLKSAPLAYQNEPFLNSPDGRILRILSEYSEPLSRFRREQIQDTVVFFGSARFHSRADAEDRLKEIQNVTSFQEHGEELARAQAAVKGRTCGAPFVWTSAPTSKEAVHRTFRELRFRPPTRANISCEVP